DALDGFCKSDGFDSRTTYFWFDCITVSQHKSNKHSKDFDAWYNLFGKAVTKIGNFALVLLPWEKSVPLTRSWYLFETCAAHDIQIAMTDLQKDGFLSSLFENSAKSCHDVLQNISMERSEATVDHDREAIMKLVRNIDFQKLHQKVFV
ncbi:hypothetical protein BC830DRAFT_1179518, partial [Chytriomyces sp. MP71]